MTPLCKHTWNIIYIHIGAIPAAQRQRFRTRMLISRTIYEYAAVKRFICIAVLWW